MTETYSTSRQRAEAAFENLQTEFFSKNNAAEELASIAQARDAKTARLREAGLRGSKPAARPRPPRSLPNEPSPADHPKHKS